jgi:tetratricopeptide (TPR) repeat protein
MRIACLLFVATLVGGAAEARKGRLGEGKPMTAEEAIADAEAALDNGRVGDAVEHSEKLQKTRGLTKEMMKRLDVIVARCGLVTGKYDVSEKIFSKLHKAQPDDSRVSEWYARALDGLGKGDQALVLLSDLAQKDELTDGDSYWALAQLERTKGQTQQALTHAETALKKPIVLQSDELDKEIHKFIDELSSSKKK